MSSATVSQATPVTTSSSATAPASTRTSIRPDAVSSFPTTRPRRFRRTEALRQLVREAWLEPGQLILPLFVRSGRGVRQPVESMPGVAQTSVDEMLRDAGRAARAGVGGVLLFGIPDTKDAIGSSAWDERGPVQEAVRALKREFPQLVAITDVCMCEYTDHGHCGVLRDGSVDNDATLELLAREALSHARAGADIVAPSDMMDGRVRAIRQELDAQGFADTAILSYAAKYASVFYGPFREAAESTPREGDRRAYQVSGEFAMIHSAAQRGWLDLDRAMMESLLAIRRAGADIIITYFAIDAG